MSKAPKVAVPTLPGTDVPDPDKISQVLDPQRRWMSWVAVSAAVLAAGAAISSMLGSGNITQGMDEQIQTSDQWSFYQAKGIKRAVLESKVELLPALGKDPAAADTDRLSRYTKEQGEIEAEAKKHQAAAVDHRRRFTLDSRAATAFQISIALCAITLLTKKPAFWGLALVVGAVGCVFLTLGLLPSG